MNLVFDSFLVDFRLKIYVELPILCYSLFYYVTPHCVKINTIFQLHWMELSSPIALYEVVVTLFYSSHVAVIAQHIVISSYYRMTKQPCWVIVWRCACPSYQVEHLEIQSCRCWSGYTWICLLLTISLSARYVKTIDRRLNHYT